MNICCSCLAQHGKDRTMRHVVFARSSIFPRDVPLPKCHRFIDNASFFALFKSSVCPKIINPYSTRYHNLILQFTLSPKRLPCLAGICCIYPCTSRDELPGRVDLGICSGDRPKNLRSLSCLAARDISNEFIHILLSFSFIDKHISM